VDPLHSVPPRTWGLPLKRALGQAARAERDHVQVPVSDLPVLASSTRTAMGFIAIHIHRKKRTE
jgi:ATP-dependent Lon protease